MKLFPRLILGLVLAGGAINAGLCPAGSIEADPSKSYPLTKSRGPWMIMVATLNTPDVEDSSEMVEGETPAQAAHQLVVELRQLGMPAYVYEYDPGYESVMSTDRFGREERRKNRRRMKSICVLAGNYNDINDKLAQDSLEWVKKLKPKCFQEGIHFQPTPGRPMALSGAFLTLNPMLSQAEAQQRQQLDPLLVKLNTGERYSLFENKGEYTLVVARFYGKHMVVKDGEEESKLSKFFKNVSLDDAAESARELVEVLRSNYDKEPTNFNNIDAFIWHDHNESVVTVGSFSSLNDPRLAELKKRFGPKMKPLPDGTVSLQSEHLGVSGFGPKGNEKRLWLFEPELEIYRVPHYGK
jgi:hypothetical protein